MMPNGDCANIAPRDARQINIESYLTTMSTIAKRQSRKVQKQEFCSIDACWRAANYLSVGQIYLYDSPLFRKPLQRSHDKPNLLEHCFTTPGQDFIYVHRNHAIQQFELIMLYISGPGFLEPAIVGSTLESAIVVGEYGNLGAALASIAIPNCSLLQASIRDRNRKQQVFVGRSREFRRSRSSNERHTSTHVTSLVHAESTISAV